MNDLLILQFNLDHELIHLAWSIIELISSIIAFVCGNILVSRHQRARKREEDERNAMATKVDKLAEKVDDLAEDVAEIRGRLAL